MQTILQYIIGVTASAISELVQRALKITDGWCTKKNLKINLAKN